MMKQLAAGAAGLVFGIGLWVSGMADPRKVIGFLDVTGAWDASLAFVMGGAVVATLAGFRIVKQRAKPLFDERFHLPTRKDIDLPLVAGAALFGMGWGIAGYCPGPALTALATLSAEALVFVAAMVAGGLLQRAIFRPA
ncbi:MAG: YeeE/YedE family protein [Proteobacteria bacterium]|nr:YeeE/YedE family protein [Pseudomonadota bacterium]MDA0982460.1 YeeE/YedE family protein [Pseudomonadota bacterium]